MPTKGLVTRNATRYRRAHGGSRRGFESGLTLVESGDGSGRLPWQHRSARRATGVRNREQCPRGAGTGAGGRGRSTLRKSCAGRKWPRVRWRFSWKWRFYRLAGSNLSEAVEETKEVRRTAKGRAFLAGRSGAPGDAPVRSRRRVERGQHAEALRKENARLRKALAGRRPDCARSEQRAETRRRTSRWSVPGTEGQDAAQGGHPAQQGGRAGWASRLQLNKRVDREQQRRRGIKGPLPKLSRENLRLHRGAEDTVGRSVEDRVRSLSDEVFWLRIALDGAKAGKEKLKARLAKLRAAGATLSKLPSDEAAQLRAASKEIGGARRRRSTCCARRTPVCAGPCGREVRKAALEVLPAKLRAIGTHSKLELTGRGREDVVEVAVRRRRRVCAGLCGGRGARRLRSSRCPGRTPACAKGAKAFRNRIETLDVQLERLRATGAVLSRALYGRKSEQQDKPRSGRKRGQQRGAPGHAAPNGPGSMSAPKSSNRRRMRACAPVRSALCRQRRRGIHPRRDRGQGLQARDPPSALAPDLRCASSPIEVSAPPAPRLFPRTIYGTSFWARFLFEH